MSNKKLFWIAFFTLSFCEFGQFAYSKNTLTTSDQANLSNEAMVCLRTHALDSKFESNEKLVSYSLPR